MQHIEELEKQLGSSNAEERREATIALGHLGAAAVRPLFNAIADSDWRVRKAAVEALVIIGDDNVTHQLISTLHAGENAGARNSAIEALIQIGRSAISALLPLLTLSDADVRKFAIDIIGEIRDPHTVPALIACLEDEDENICIASAEALGKIRDPRAIDALVPCLRQPTKGWLAHAAAQALGEIGSEQAVRPLLESLELSSLREPVIEALGKLGNMNILPMLIGGLTDQLRIVREVSIVAIAAIERKASPPEKEVIVHMVRASMSVGSVSILEEILSTSTGDLQKSTILLLGWIGRESSIHKLMQLLIDEEYEDPITQALESLSKEQAALLVNYLSNDNSLVRRTVARVLGDKGVFSAEPLLIGLLRDNNGHVRSEAAIALSRLGSKRAFKSLVNLLTDEYVSVQETAIQALAIIADESMIDELIMDFSTRNTLLRRNISLLLGKFTINKAVAALAFALKDENPDVRKAVVQALGNAPASQALKSLLLAITDDDPEVRMLAVTALGKTDSPMIMNALIPLLEDKDLWVRAAAARGLGRIGGEKAGKILMTYLDTAHDIFLLALVEALGNLKLQAVQEKLVKLVEHPDPEVRKVVLTTLIGYGGESVRQAALAGLSDSHWSVRKAAISVLEKSRDAAVEGLLETVARSDSDLTVRKAAQEALKR